MTKAILGIDPGTSTGAVIRHVGSRETNQLLICLDRYSPGPGRLSRLWWSLTDNLKTFEADVELVVIEGYAYQRFGRGSFTLGEYGGVIRLAIAAMNVPYVVVQPQTLKKFISPDRLAFAKKGQKTKASKDAIQTWVRELYGFDAESPDVADAYVLARIGEVVMGHDKPRTVMQREVARDVGKEIDRSHVNREDADDRSHAWKAPWSPVGSP